MRRIATLLTCIGLLALAGVAYANIGLSSHKPVGRHHEAGLRSRPAVELEGHIRGLTPGVRTRLAVTLRSQVPFPMRVRWVSAKVRDASQGCLREYLKLRAFKGDLPLAPHETRVVKLEVWLSAAAPDACQGARFPLRYQMKAQH